MPNQTSRRIRRTEPAGGKIRQIPPQVRSGALWLAAALLFLNLPACRKETPKPQLKRPGDISLVHPLARNVRRKTISGKKILEMAIPVSPRRALAYYEHGLAKSWHLVQKTEDNEGTHLRVRRGLQLLDIHARPTPDGTKMEIVEQVRKPEPNPQGPVDTAPDETTARKETGGTQGPTQNKSAETKRARPPTPQSFEGPDRHLLPKGIRLPKGWKAPEPGKSSAYLNEATDLAELANQLRRSMKAQKWTVMPTPENETSDRPNELDLVFSKGKTVLYLHLRGTSEGTSLTWVQASL